MSFPIDLLKKWFLSQRRELPWRQNLTPYSVWISEIMLQQTQVPVVIPYFEKWMLAFPTIESLANASLEEVIKMWEGLGYYSRARNIHQAAKKITHDYQGIIPNCPHKLKEIKGIGDYTLGAILSFAFHYKIAAIDGNVNRVGARYFGVKDDLSKSTGKLLIKKKIEEILPDQESWIFNEALIELGATVCSKKPKCQQCPLQISCYAYRHQEQAQIPFKSMKIKTAYLTRMVSLIRYNNFWLVKKVPKGEIMSDLYEFPYFESENGNFTDHFELIKNTLGLEVELLHILDKVNHSFTRYQATLYPYLFKCNSKKEIANYQWLTFEQLLTVPFSSGHRRIFAKIKGNMLV